MPITTISNNDNVTIIDANYKAQAFDIIENKNVDILDIRKAKTVEDYNFAVSSSNLNRKELTQEEFDTLKEWMR